VTMRQISARKGERVAAAKKYHLGISATPMPVDFRDATVSLVEESLQAAFLITFAQGFSLLKAASDEKGYELDPVEVTKIWRGGCIIRAALLEEFRLAFESEPSLENILLSDKFVPYLMAKQAALKMVVNLSQHYDVPCIALAASLNFFLSYKTERLPANLIQAQRDFFGAHTYQRIDKDGIFHTPDWADSV